MNEWTATSPFPTTGNVWAARLICGLRIQPLKRKGSPSSMLPVLVSFFFSFFLAIFWNGANSTTAGYSRPFIETCAKRHYETVPSSLRKTITKLPWGWSMTSDCFGKSGWQRSQSLLHDTASRGHSSLTPLTWKGRKLSYSTWLPSNLWSIISEFCFVVVGLVF